MKDTYRSSLVFSIHGIRTKAAWQRALSETLSRDNIPCSSYNFGYYSLLRFLFQPSNKKMIDLFYEYYSEVLANHTDMIDLNNSMKRPSIVVHSFGSYILGYCMLKYPDVKFDKIILCGSILPTTFDWATLLVRDQVNRVLNEYGLDDIWAKVVGIFIPKTGKSGATGFQVRSVQIQEKRYDFFKHGDYFRGQHILTYWLPFLNQPPGQYFIRHGHDF